MIRGEGASTQLQMESGQWRGSVCEERLHVQGVRERGGRGSQPVVDIFGPCTLAVEREDLLMQWHICH